MKIKKLYKNKKLLLRRISQLIFLLLFLFLFIQTQPEIGTTSYMVRGGDNVDLFFRADPLIALSASLSSRSILIENFMPALLIAVLALFFGSFFCGWVCPLGACIDIAAAPFKRIHKKRKKLPARFFSLKYYILFALLVLVAAGINFAGYMDPITIIFRALAYSIEPFTHTVIHGVLAPLSMNDKIGRFIDPVYSFFTDNILTFEKLKFSHGWIYLSIFLSILLINIYHRRFWCTWLCPLGAIHSLFAKTAVFQRRVSGKCVECGLCAKECKTGAISMETAHDCKTGECVFCFACEGICPKDAISFSPSNPLTELKKNKQNAGKNAAVKNNKSKDKPKKDADKTALENKKENPNAGEIESKSRRGFIIAGAAGLLAIPVIRAFGAKSNKKENTLLRPPGVEEEKEFLNKCIRCGECMRVCTRNALHPALSQSGIEGIWTPVLIPRIGYCEYNCDLCGKVCPTGAIKSLSIPDKQVFKIGIAVINPKICLPWAYNTNCAVCEEACPISEKAIKLAARQIKKPDGTVEEIKSPVVDPALCIGCGICENHCPLSGESAIRVYKNTQDK